MRNVFTKLFFIMITFMIFIVDLHSAELKIMADDTLAAQYFGQSLSINGDYLLVGARWDKGKGAAYIFYKDEGGQNNWGQQKKLFADDGSLYSFAEYGRSVAIDGDYALVGSDSDDLGDSTNAGSAFLYNRNEGGENSWGKVKKITADDSASNNYFGISVSISDTIIAIGARQELNDGLDSTGSVYIFYRNRGGTDNWGQVARIKPADGNGSDFFGYSVALSGSDLVVGAWGFNSGVGGNQGKTYIYSKDEGGIDNWGLQAQHIPTIPGVNHMGYSVDIDGDYIVSGAPASDTSGALQNGDCYIYYRNQGGTNNWGLQQKIVASDPEDLAHFGESVSIDNNYLVVGAPIDSLERGAMYAFLRSGTSWTQTSKTISSDVEAGDRFGFSVGTSGDYSVSGAGLDSVSTFDLAGSAYIYESIADLSLPVTLSLFNVIANDSQVEINWRTESEIENLGFIIKRSTTKDGEYEEISSYKTNQSLMGQINSASAKDYYYADNDIVYGKHYWYRLIDVNINGKQTTHGPVHAIVTSESENLVASYNLMPVYPNPFNLTTKFTVNVIGINEKLNNVILDIYNNRGQKIKSIYSGYLETGIHNFSWNGTSEIGREVASGMYLLVLRGKNQYITQKMLLLK